MLIFVLFLFVKTSSWAAAAFSSVGYIHHRSTVPYGEGDRRSLSSAKEKKPKWRTPDQLMDAASMGWEDWNYLLISGCELMDLLGQWSSQQSETIKEAAVVTLRDAVVRTSSPSPLLLCRIMLSKLDNELIFLKEHSDLN